ncbi:cytoplasmic tRNA 2-thiolation protein 2 [Phalaenopsis equestris]|uniref:cytoplasmic tRNA 2-thiolation protein 2 n=1 Tax=Phalaenopsis equestris TaxID=78828 RepID=UPI0009E45ECD|nr:cytoplasmic tRNA 2-thiolation protein 2 [Phalaenopsis equestris]XP_020579143.1 cytoplasmic tRNA 2-thiolation protein 2 [Phalaenopsis equestris]
MTSCGGNGGGSCQSLCHETKYDELLPQPQPAAQEDDTRDRLGSKGDQLLCSKCGEEKSAWSGLCLACFRSSLYGKFKLAVTSNAMISPSDKVLVAFSGGPASRVALQFTHELQCKSLKNWDASKSQGLPVFGVGVAFVDESSVSPNSSNVVSNIFEEINSIVSEIAPAQKTLHVMAIESLFCKDFDDGRRCLNELLDGITDVTGREDFTQSLRMLTLQKIALDNRYTKLLLGSCTSKMARVIISATVKGQGFSLPADLQYVDARWEVPVVLPLRDCLAQELAMLCHLDGLKTIQLFNRPSGINSLVSSFVARLQEENPSRERTIVRTGEKLKSFSFNKFTQDGYYDFLPSIIRSKFQNIKYKESKPKTFCPICGSPLSDSEWQHLQDVEGMCQTKIEMFASQCCRTCRFQIIPKDRSSLEKFYLLLPSLITNRIKDQGCADQSLLREQIEEFLINEDDDSR